MSDALNLPASLATKHYVGCTTCIFWTMTAKEALKAKGDQPAQAGGVCRRLPPLPVVTIQQNPLTQQASQVVQAMHPQTLERDWCGEYDNGEADGDAI